MEPRASLAFLEPGLHIFWFWHLPAPDLFTLSSLPDISQLATPPLLLFPSHPHFLFNTGREAAEASGPLGSFYQVSLLPGPNTHPD